MVQAVSPGLSFLLCSLVPTPLAGPGPPTQTARGDAGRRHQNLSRWNTRNPEVTAQRWDANTAKDLCLPGPTLSHGVRRPQLTSHVCLQASQQWPAALGAVYFTGRKVSGMLVHLVLTAIISTQAVTTKGQWSWDPNILSAASCCVYQRTLLGLWISWVSKLGGHWGNSMPHLPNSTVPITSQCLKATLLR